MHKFSIIAKDINLNALVQTIFKNRNAPLAGSLILLRVWICFSKFGERFELGIRCPPQEMQTTVGRTRTHGYERSVNDVSVAMATKRRKLRSPEDGFCNELDALLPGILLNADRKKFYQWQLTFA
ncbi:hypothetical protein TNCT_157261 [Trichonephila clavata]|uniref:Uncharacterized protein n=1 Tax=Trichonephila clavata TaxID=2740835 RepID=A0A8X6L7J5_TRICU|nr:hypothetical protein TNCT_157261 [Trichonephila clavata]